MTPEDRQRLSQRVARRVQGRALFDTIRDLIEWDELPHEARQAVIDAMKDTMAPPPSELPDPDPLTDLIEAGRYQITFGKYAGMSLTELEALDRPYLEWLADCTRETHEAVALFVRLRRNVTRPTESPPE